MHDRGAEKEQRPETQQACLRRAFEQVVVRLARREGHAERAVARGAGLGVARVDDGPVARPHAQQRCILDHAQRPPPEAEARSERRRLRIDGALDHAERRGVALGVPHVVRREATGHRRGDDREERDAAEHQEGPSRAGEARAKGRAKEPERGDETARRAEPRAAGASDGEEHEL